MEGHRGVGIVGCGLIGNRRAREVARHSGTRLVAVADTDLTKAQLLADEYQCKGSAQWQAVIDDPAVSTVVVATPNGYSFEIGACALQAGKSVLLEKPPGRNLDEARGLAEAARSARGAILKIGFNHRYHPGVSRAYELYRRGVIGEAINLRARYGHGGRPGYEKEWRGSHELAGGGELTDQGVHIADLIHWFLGPPKLAFAMLQTAVWPLVSLEDNAFGLLRFAGGAVASIHTSWTQWKNLFSFELFGRLGSLSLEGLAGSYGNQRLTCALRKPEGGAPEMKEETFEGTDRSWELEWREFIEAVEDGRPYMGTPEDGVAAMSIIDALYRSAASGATAIPRD